MRSGAQRARNPCSLAAGSLAFVHGGGETVSSDPRDQLLAEVDLALVHALQVNARAPWARIAEVIGVDPATAARRWAAINARGAAWFAVWPTPERHAARSDAALVRVAARITPEAADAWCRTPWVLAVERTSVGTQALVVGHGGLAALEQRIHDLVALVDDPGPVHVEYAAAVPRDDSSWRLRVLSATQVRDLSEPRTPGLRAPSEEAAAEVTALLREDARMTWGAMAARMGVRDATARRTVERVLAHGLVRIGCDVAMPAVGLGRGVVVRARADATFDPDALLRSPAVHRVLRLVGPAEWTVSCRFTSLTELDAVERAWGPGLGVVDRWTVTAALKRNGHLLDASGRSTGEVDVDW